MTDLASRIGVLLHGELPPNQIAKMSRLVEDAGFAELWMSEDYFLLSGFASAAIALQATERVKLGIGAVSNRVRHPAVTAMEAATLAGAFPGRFYNLGLGHGVPAWMKQMHLSPKSALESLKEALLGVSRLLKGETLTEVGTYYSYDKVKLHHPAPDLKVMAAVVGPKSVDLTATNADGLQISVLAGPKYVKAVADRMRDARIAAGLTPGSQIVTYVLTCVDADRKKARAHLRKIAAFYIAATGPTLLTSAYGVDEEITGLLKEGGIQALEAGMPDEWLDWLGIAGTGDEAAASVKALVDAGSTSVILCLVPSEESAQQIEICGREVLPKLWR